MPFFWAKFICCGRRGTSRTFWGLERRFAMSCVAGAGHRTPFHPCGRRGTFWTLLKRWQAWVKMRGAFGGHFAWQAQYLVNLDDVLKGRKSKASFSETVVILILDMVMVPCARRIALVVARCWFSLILGILVLSTYEFSLDGPAMIARVSRCSLRGL